MKTLGYMVRSAAILLLFITLLCLSINTCNDEPVQTTCIINLNQSEELIFDELLDCMENSNAEAETSSGPDE